MYMVEQMKDLSDAYGGWSVQTVWTVITYKTVYEPGGSHKFFGQGYVWALWVSVWKHPLHLVRLGGAGLE